MGAILLDTGFNLELVWTIALSFLDPILSPIRELEELCQANNLNLQSLVEARGNGTDVCTTASAINLNKKNDISIASQKIFTKLKVKPVCFL